MTKSTKNACKGVVEEEEEVKEEEKEKRTRCQGATPWNQYLGNG